MTLDAKYDAVLAQAKKAWITAKTNGVCLEDFVDWDVEDMINEMFPDMDGFEFNDVIYEIQCTLGEMT